MAVSKVKPVAKKSVAAPKISAEKKPAVKKTAAAKPAAKAAPTKAAKPKTKPSVPKAAAPAKGRAAKAPSAETAKGNGDARITPEQRYRMICDAAYYRAERRGFVGGSPSDDWIAAEAEVDELLRSIRH